jgi:hypothetical protein
MGDPLGQPAIMLHGIVDGYLYPPQFENRIQAAGIKLYFPHRPGCGGSARNSQIDLATDIERSLLALCQEEGLSAVPIITVSATTIPVIRMAAADESPFSLILATGRFLPFSKARLLRMAPKTRAFAWAACNAPWLARGMGKLGYRILIEQGVDWFIEQSLGMLPFDRATAYQTEILPLIRNACSFTFLNGPEPFFDDFAMRSISVSDFAPEIKIPVHWMLGSVHIYEGRGKVDDLDSEEDIAEFIKLNPLISFERVNDAGFLMTYQKPELIADRLVQLMQDN